MRQALQAPQRQTHNHVISLPPPLGGWNTATVAADMDPRFAVSMTNLVPGPSTVALRKGYSASVTGFTSPVESLMAYRGLSASKLFAASGTSIYDASTAGAVGAAVVTATVNARFQHVVFGNAGAQYLMCANGGVHPWNYNGTVWAQTPAITGVTAANLIHVNAFKQRLFFIEKNTMLAWYLPVNAIGGAAASLDFASYTQLGGSLMAMGTWTMDGGSGIDDHAVWVTSEGEVLIYKGTDPSSASTWALVGVYRIGRPVGRRCLTKLGGDLAIITVDGVIPLSQVLATERVRSGTLSDRIREAVQLAYQKYGTVFGWQLQVFPPGGFILLNVPANDTTYGSEQFVMNLQTKAWCKFTGWDAQCFELFGDHLYFGSDTTTNKAWETFADNGLSITGSSLQAFSHFGARGRLKSFKLIRPVLYADTTINAGVGLGIDYDLNPSISTASFSALPTAATWDVSSWDTSYWKSPLQIQKAWQAVIGIGYTAAPAVEFQGNNAEIIWASTDVMVEAGERL